MLFIAIVTLISPAVHAATIASLASERFIDVVAYFKSYGIDGDMSVKLADGLQNSVEILKNSKAGKTRGGPIKTLLASELPTEKFGEKLSQVFREAEIQSYTLPPIERVNDPAIAILCTSCLTKDLAYYGFDAIPDNFYSHQGAKVYEILKNAPNTVSGMHRSITVAARRMNVAVELNPGTFELAHVIDVRSMYLAMNRMSQGSPAEIRFGEELAKFSRTGDVSPIFGTDLWKIIGDPRVKDDSLNVWSDVLAKINIRNGGNLDANKTALLTEMNKIVKDHPEKKTTFDAMKELNCWKIFP
jgi:hypothetical protein